MLGLNLSASVRPTNAWWTPGAIFAADFVNDRYMRDGVNISRDAALTVTRPSPKLARTLAGEWLSFPPNTLARTDRGASIEPASTNYVQNSTMAGAIPGAPGTAPTGWTVPTSSNGLVRQITAVGTSKGLPHIDIRFSGTTTAESFLNLYLCPGYVPTPAQRLLVPELQHRPDRRVPLRPHPHPRLPPARSDAQCFVELYWGAHGRPNHSFRRRGSYAGADSNRDELERQAFVAILAVLVYQWGRHRLHDTYLHPSIGAG